MIQRLQEKASIDWNNYLTPEEVQKFLSKDDKVESAENIIYSKEFMPRYKDLHNNLQKKYNNSWNKRELVQDLVQFYEFGNLITESKENYEQQIKNIVDKCINAGLKDKLKEYTIPCMRDYQLRFNPTADNRVTPWLYLVKELKDNKNHISWELQEFIDTFIKEANKCYKDNNKLQESKYILRGTQDGKTFDIAYSDSEQKLQNFKDEMTKGNPNVSMWIDQNNKLTAGKLEEASRNELLAKTKMQTKTRYNKADGYKGFGLKNVNVNNLLKDGTLPVTCKVGKYNDTVELENVPYWIQLQAKRNNNNQLSNHVVRDAILQAVDAMDIKVDCDCGDFKYRMAWGATEGGYKYGQPENRPANITNPNKYGALCKHLTAMLSNKKWMQQVAAPVLDYIEEHLEELNKFLNVKQGEELIMPNELARGMAKKAAQGRKQDREQRLQEVAKEFIRQRKNFIIRNANDDEELLEGIKAYINYKYKDQDSGVDYLKADTMEQEYILDIVNKWLIDHNYKKDYEEEFEQQNNEQTEEGENNEEPKQ